MKNIGLCFLLLFSMSLVGQGELVKTKSSGEMIMLKWFPEELVNSEGFNVFRSENGGEFSQLNSDPIKLDITDIARESDVELRNYMQMAQRYAEGGESEPLLKFYILVKSMTSDDFAKFIGIRYNDRSAVSGNSYVYQVKRVSNSRILGTSESETLEEDLPIDPPVDTRLAFQSGSRNTFTWLPETDRYFAVNAYRRAAEESNFIKLNATPIIPSQAPDQLGIVRYPDFLFEDTLISKASYYYKFKAIDAFGDEGEESEEIFVRSKDETPPVEVTGLTISNTETEITINWNPSRSKDVAGYHVYRSLNGDTTYLQRTSTLIDETRFVDPIDRPGTYMYVIGAYDEAGNSSFSEREYIIVSDLTPPPNPTNLSVNVEPGKVSISWDGEQPGDFWGYKVMRTDNENPRKDDFQLIIPEPIRTESFDNILAGESELALYYAIAALDTFNNESEWLISEKVMTPDTVSPKAPVIINVRAEEKSVNLEWMASPDLDVVGYQVYRCEKEDMNWVSLDEDLGIESLSFVDNNPVLGEFLCYKVVAKDDAGNISQASNVYTIKAKANNISGEERVKLSSVKHRKNKEHVELEWEADKSLEYRGYMVFRSANGEKFVPASSFITETNFQDENIKENSAYKYQIKAFTGKGVVLISNIQTLTIK